MNILENLISLVAPHNCIVCDLEGGLLCQGCLNAELTEAVSRCYRCHQASSNQAVCKNCRKTVFLSYVWAATDYGEIPKRLIHKLKFERAVAAAIPVAEKISQTLPKLPADTIICHIPPANSRVRIRGYDQAEQIAKNLAKISGLKHKNLLSRKGKSRQVGSGRTDRFKQLGDAFKITNPYTARNASILLIDDITTTGATIESAARTLKKSGAEIIDAAVFAQA
jgi:competence protein ComFC